MEAVLQSFQWNQFISGEVSFIVKRVGDKFEIYTTGFENSDIVASLTSNRDFITPLLSILQSDDSSVKITATIAQSAVQVGKTRIDAAAVERSELKELVGRVNGKFLSRLPNYIRSLFDDQ